MIDVKIIKKPKGKGAMRTGGIATGGNGYNAGAAGEALHALRADEAAHAVLADNAGEATHAQQADNAGEATHARQADNAAEAVHAASATEATHADSAHNLDADSPVYDEFLSRKHDDTAAGHITFENHCTFERGLTSKTRVDIGEYSDNTGASAFMDDNGTSHVVADYVRVRRKFSAEEVEIRRTTHVGGSFLSSPASAVITRITEHTDELGYRYWRCYFDACDAQGRAVTNDFRQNDMVRCRTFNLETAGDGTTGNRYYWRLAIGLPGTVSTVYDERTGTRLTNLCTTPYPTGISDKNGTGELYGSGGGPTASMAKPAPGTAYTIRLTGTWPSDAQGRPRGVTVFAGGWNHGTAIADKAHSSDGKGFIGGIPNEEITLHFTTDSDPSALTGDIWIYASIYDGDTAIGDPGTKITGIAIVEGTVAALSGRPVLEHYVQLSDREGWKDPAGTTVPSAGDHIVTVGNTTYPERQNVIMLSSYDGGEGVAPCMLLYKGIDTFALPDSRLTAKLSPQGNIINGEFRVLTDGTYKSIKDYADSAAKTYFDVNIEGIAARVEGAETDILELLATADGITSTVSALGDAVGQNASDISEIRQTASEISLRVGEMETPRANLCKPLTGDLVQHPAGDGYFGAVKDGGVDIEACGLTRPIPAGTTVTIRLRGRFGATSGSIALFLGGWDMGISIPKGKYLGGADNETVTCTVTTPEQGTPGTALYLQMCYDGDMPTADKALCRISSVIIVEGSTIPAELIAEDGITERLYGTGIDIRKHSITVTADNFVVQNNKGQQSAVITQEGKIAAALIDADNVTARNVEVGDPEGEHVSITPDTESIEIYDNNGRLRTTLSGESYANGPGDVYSGASGGDISAPARTVELPAKSGTAQTFNLCEFTVGAPCVLEFSAGSITANVASYTDEYLGQAGMSNSPYVSARIALELTDTGGVTQQSLWTGGAYADASMGTNDGHVIDTAAYDFTRHSCRLAPGTYRLRLTVTFVFGNAGNVAGRVVLSAVAGRWSSEGYISRYFANGFILGSRYDRYIAAWHDNATGAMCFEAQNTDCALRSDGTGALKVKHLGSSKWMALPMPVAFGRTHYEGGALTVQSDFLKTFDGTTAAAFSASRQSAGMYRVNYPAAWQAHNFHPGAVLLRLTGLSGSSPTIRNQDASGFSVQLAGDGDFAFELWKL